ncbi:MAG TPA: DUF542 domain-containing protein [Gemmatimonadaceae bacterium]|nr:DUF542 domain-containing protein [Gemmatimonadaceae bacterium]
MNTDVSTIESTMTLDEITNRFPDTIRVFNEFGMDICCGGGVSLAEAAERDGVAIESIERALRVAVTSGAGNR